MKAHLPIPAEVITKAHSGFMGKTGSGKSSVMRVCAEYLHLTGKRVCILDPKGDWYGIKSDATGKGPGLPFILFGDYKVDGVSDIPLREDSGKEVASLICNGNRPAVLGLGGWMPKPMARFTTDFLSTLFSSRSGQIYLLIDECHNFAPKSGMFDAEVSGILLHWMKRILTEGRGLGITALIASQRPQKVHNDVLSSCETLFAMRVLHESDRGAIHDWVKGCGDKERGLTVLNSLAQMEVAEAYVWSPSNNFGPKRIKFPMFQTLDSFAPPQDQPAIKQASWADVDLVAVKQRLETVIEERRKSDPKFLREEIRKLQLELKGRALPFRSAESDLRIQSLEQETIALREAVIRAEYALAHDFKAYQDRLVAISNLADQAVGSAPTLSQAELKRRIKERFQGNVTLETVKQVVDYVAKHSDVVPKTSGVAIMGSNQLLPSMDRAFLIALAQNPNGLTKTQILTLADYRAGGAVSRCFAKMCREGWAISHGGMVQITPTGLEVLGAFEPLPTGAALREYILKSPKNSTMERKMMEVLFSVHPESITKSQILALTGYAAGGAVSRAFAKLIRLNWAVSSGPSLLKASDNFFKD